MDAICHLWRSPTRGTLAHSREAWARLIGVSATELDAALEELRAFSICEVEQDGNGGVRLSSRRMLRDEKARQSNAEYQRKHRQKAKVRNLSRDCKAENQSQSHSQNHSQIHSHNKDNPPLVPPRGGRSESRASGGDASQAKAEALAPIEWIVKMWNAFPCFHEFEGEPGERTRRRLNKLWLEHPEPSWWVEYFRRIAGTHELTGRLESGFRASLTWALDQNNIEKVLGGHYGKPHPIEEEA